MRYGLGILVVLALVLGAGCVGPAAEPGSMRTTTDAAPAPTTRTDGSPATTPSSTGATTPAPSPSTSAAPTASPAPTSPEPSPSPTPTGTPSPTPTATQGPTGTPSPTPAPGPSCASTPATGGHDDAFLPTLTWAALKTGHRLVVAWDSGVARQATLEYSIDGAPYKRVADDGSRAKHVFIVNGLPLNRIVCFRVFETNGPSSEVHAVLTANAMNAYDALSQSYTLNMLVSAKFKPNRADLEAGMSIFAATINDATEGYVRVGETIVVYAPADASYVIVYGATLFPQAVVHDVIFQYDYPAAAGYTWRDAIQEPDRFIIMNQISEAGPTGLWDAHEVGQVLAHEVGHYAFGAMDLYTDTDDCWSKDLGLSVMGSSRDATELDDAINRCPNEASIDGYVPSWTLLRARFPMIPDRHGNINPGPGGTGPSFNLQVIDFG